MYKVICKFETIIKGKYIDSRFERMKIQRRYEDCIQDGRENPKKKRKKIKNERNKKCWNIISQLSLVRKKIKKIVMT